MHGWSSGFRGNLTAVMKLPSHHQQRSPLTFNITPLIDVVFLLIIFFLVASHFVRSEQAETIELPDATGEMDDEAQSPHRLTVTINVQGQYFIGGEPVDEQTVMNRITELAESSRQSGIKPQLRLRGHRHAQYGPMRKLIEQAARHGIQSIRFAVNTGEDD